MRSLVHRTVDIYFNSVRPGLSNASMGGPQIAVVAQLTGAPATTRAARHYATDYCSSRSLLFYQRSQQRGLVFGRHHQKQSPGGLRVHTEISVSGRELGCPLHPLSRGEVSLRAARDHSAGGKAPGVGKHRYAVEGDLGCHLAGLQDVAQVAQQPEPGHISGGADTDPERSPGGTMVQRDHRAYRLSHSGLEESVALER